MATHSAHPPETFTADAAFTRYQVAEVGSTDNGVIVATDATASMLGVAMAPAASGAQVPIQMEGIVKCIASGAITRGTLVTADTGGKIQTYTNPGAAATNFYLGEALESATADGDVISVHMQPGTNTGT